MRATLLIIALVAILFSACDNNKWVLKGMYYKNNEIKKDGDGNILIPLDLNNDSIIDLVLKSSSRDSQYFLWKKGLNPNKDLVVYLFQFGNGLAYRDYLQIYDVLLPGDKRGPKNNSSILSEYEE